MRRLLFVLALLATLHAAHAQDPTRVVVLPFEAAPPAAAWGLGLPVTLQRSLNSLDGVYAPPVGETALVAGRAASAGDDGALARLFGADVVIGGRVEAAGEGLVATLVARGPGLAEPVTATASAPSGRPEQLTRAALEALVGLAGLRPNASDLQEAVRTAEEVPPLAALQVVAQAGARLGGPPLARLREAAALSEGSSFAQAELARALALAGLQEEALAASGRARSAQPSDAEAAAVAGVVRLGLGDVPGAREDFETALALNPGHAVALAGLARATDDPERRRALLERAVAAAPRLLEAHLDLADLAPSDARALQTLRRAARFLPDSVGLHRAFVERALRAGDPDGALAYLRETAGDALAASPALYALAGELPASVADAALAFVREGRERYPETASPVLAEAELLRARGEPVAAQEVLAGLEAQARSSAEIANSLALARLEAGDPEGALRAYEAYDGDDPRLRLNHGQLLLERERPRQALAPLATAARGLPGDAAAQRSYGLALAAAGRAQEARAALRRALELDPDDAASVRALELLEQQRALLGDADAVFQGAAASLFARGLGEVERGDFAAAAAAFAEARAAQDHPLLAFYEGYALARAGRPAAALAPYERALEGFPESDVVANNLGHAQLLLGRFDLALPTLRRARELNPENPRVHLNLGLVLFGLARYDEALAAFDRAVALEPALEPSLADVREEARRRSAP